MRALIFALSVLVAVSARADDVSEVWTTRTASQISQITGVESALKLPMTKQNRSMIEAEIKAKKFDLEVPNVQQLKSDELTLEFKDRTITMGFEKIGERKLRIGKTYITLSKTKTFLNYRNEVEAALRSKSASLMGLMIEEAEAQGLGARFSEGWRSISNFTGLTSLWLSSALPQDLDGRSGEGVATVTDVLLKSYGNALFKAEYPEYGVDEGFFKTLTFTCNGDKVAKVTDDILLIDHRHRQPGSGMSSISPDGKGGWTWTNYGGVRKVTAEGDVLDANGKKTGRNLWKNGPFFRFPEIAGKCCRTNGCAATVNNALRAEVEDMSDGPDRTAPSRARK